MIILDAAFSKSLILSSSLVNSEMFWLSNCFTYATKFSCLAENIYIDYNKSCCLAEKSIDTIPMSHRYFTRNKIVMLYHRNLYKIKCILFSFFSVIILVFSILFGVCAVVTESSINLFSGYLDVPITSSFVSL